MLRNVNQPDDLQRLLIALLSTSGTLAGLSLTLVGIVDIKVLSTKVETIADNMFLFAALGFVLVCYLIFFTLRIERKTSNTYAQLIPCASTT